MSKETLKVIKSQVYTKYVGTVLWFSVYSLNRGMATGRIGVNGKDGEVYDFTLRDVCLDTIRQTEGKLQEGDVVEFWAKEDTLSAADVKLLNRRPKENRVYSFFDRVFGGPKEELSLIERPRNRG